MRIEYTLTDRAINLGKVIKTIYRWARKKRSNTGSSYEFGKRRFPLNKWMTVVVILVSGATVLIACSNNPEKVELTPVVDGAAPAVTDNSPNEFPQTLGYTEIPPTIDPAKGYFVDEIADGIYWLLGRNYQTLFFTTGQGVIVIDAPQPIGTSYLEAIREVTDEPITHMIYSHSHNDHVGAAGIFPPDIEYISHQDTAELLRGVPKPTITFDESYTLEVENQVIELSYIGTYHSSGDLIIYAPRQKVLMVVDLFHPGAVPFSGFGVTVDLAAHLQAHDLIIEEYDFNVLIPGHTEILATKTHLETNRAFILSMQEIVRLALDSVTTEQVIQTCIDKTIAQWDGILDHLENRVAANCAKMQEFVVSE